MFRLLTDKWYDLQSWEISASPYRSGIIVKLTHLFPWSSTGRGLISGISRPHNQPWSFLDRPHSKAGLQRQPQTGNHLSIPVSPWKIRAPHILQAFVCKPNGVLPSALGWHPSFTSFHPGLFGIQSSQNKWNLSWWGWSTRPVALPSQAGQWFLFSPAYYLGLQPLLSQSCDPPYVLQECRVLQALSQYPSSGWASKILAVFTHQLFYSLLLQSMEPPSRDVTSHSSLQGFKQVVHHHHLLSSPIHNRFYPH